MRSAESLNTDMIDGIRKKHLAVAEFIDAWRLIPRGLVIGYAYLLYEVVHWFMLLEAPTTQQAGLVTAIIGGGAAVFGLYSSSSRSWNGFTKWNGANSASSEEETVV